MTENGKVKRGVCKEKDGYLTHIIESNLGREADGRIMAAPLSGAPEFEVDGKDPVSMNMLGFTPKLFDYLETKFVEFFDKNKDNKATCEYLIPDVVSELIEANKVQVKVLPTTAVWQGITYKEDKEKLVNELASLVKKGDYPSNLWA